MKTIFETSAYEDIVSRTKQLTPDSQRNWGVMTPNQMLCHLSDTLRSILGIKATPPVLPAEVEQQLKGIIFGEAEWEHTYKTFPCHSQDEDGEGTKPTGFEQDRQALIDLLNQLYNTPADYKFSPHPGLNVLTREEAGMYVWRHNDYHVRQFGV